MAAAQQDATERALRKAKRGRPMEFRRKGHQEQFEFNEQVEDHLEAASKKIKKIAAPADSDSKKFLKEVLEELQEGVDVVAERQKHIQIADQSEYHWRTVEAYKVGALGDSNDDAKKIKEAERDVAHQLSREKKKPNREGRPPPPPPPVFHQWVPAVPQPQQMLLPQQAPPRHQGFYKPPGPCFNCYQMGHIKANCPKLMPQQYPLSSSYNNLRLMVCGSVLDSPVVCGDALDKSTVCENVLDSSYSNISMTEGGNIPSSSYGNAVVAVCGNDDSTVCHLASVNSSFAVNDPLEACTSASDDSVKAACPLDDIGHPAVDSSVSTLPNAMSESASSGMSTHEKDAPDCSGHDISIDSAEGEVDHTEVPGPDDAQALTTFWEVEEGQTQVMDVQGRLGQSLSFWEDTLDPAPWIISCIREGYKLPLRSIPDCYHKPNQQSALSHQQFVEHWGLTQFYVFSVLPFGLATACYAFTKLLRPLIKYWRSQGLRALLYLDDGIVAVKGRGS